MSASIGDLLVHGLIGLICAVLLLDFFVRWKRLREVEPGILFLLMMAAVFGISAGALHFVFPEEGGHVAYWPAGSLLVLGVSAALAFYCKRRHRDVHLAEQGLPTCFKTNVMKHRRHAVEAKWQLGYSLMLFLAIASLGTAALVDDLRPVALASAVASGTTPSAAASGDPAAPQAPDGKPQTVAELLAAADRNIEEQASATAAAVPAAAPAPAADRSPAASAGDGDGDGDGDAEPDQELALAEAEAEAEGEGEGEGDPEADSATAMEPDAAPADAAATSPVLQPAPGADAMAARTPVIGRPGEFNPATKRPRNIPKNVFASHIRPILNKHCFSCHGRDKQKGGLRLDTPEGIRKGGKNGRVAVAGDPDNSPLYTSTILPADDPDIMPAKGDPLNKKETELLRKWILFGADLGDGKHFADASSGGAGFAVDQLADGLSLPDAALVESLKADGVLIRPISANQALLDIDFSHLEDKSKLDLKRLSPIARNVHSLDLTRSRVGDADLAAVAPMQNLVRLQLNQTNIGDNGVQHLRGLANLEVLNLYSTRVTDAGLVHLVGLQKLQKLYLWESKATPEGAGKLTTALPNLKIVF